MPDRRPGSELLDRSLSASAGLVAITALAVSVYQAKITREQQKMSAWPYVTQGNTGAGYSRVVQNVGLGPALVRSVIVTIDGRAVRTWGAVLRAGLRVDSAALAAMNASSGGTTTSSLWRGMVVLPGSTVELIHVRSGDFAQAVRGLLNDDRFHMRICYCSLYEDCWASDNRALEPAPVASCPADSDREFRG